MSLYIAVVFWALPLGMAFAFLGVQLAVFGVYMGASFAPNHKGTLGIPYTEAGIFESYRIVIRYLNEVGLAARDPFDCPMVNRFRRT